MSAMGSHDIRNEGRRQRWLCDECGAEYGSYTAAERCEIADRKEQRHD
jgi:transposase-like protein